ncbi:nucleolar transcription factor 1-like [Plectropomus leopardus]|uniref:nucleolar transcription factor 1-like n=1 Tax=Plectropomus leopardus TaxID=160734 RepID=UPI001C4C1725|nr:nucleolar transcription factor 1-like [Plectropomus leopardus]
MDQTKKATEEAVWTKEDLQKLLAAIKSNIPAQDRMTVYTKVLQTLNWSEVAFPPFSPEDCKEKWRQILQRMRKVRSLTELVVEAEDLISSPVSEIKTHLDRPKKPIRPHINFYEENRAEFLEKHPDLGRRSLFELLTKKYRELPDEEKAPYVEKHKLAMDKYKKKMLEFSKQYKLRSKGEGHSANAQSHVERQDGDEDEAANKLPPRPPYNGYILFCKEQGTSMPYSTTTTIVRVWAQRWWDLTEEQRKEYNSRCKMLQNQYSIKLNSLRVRKKHPTYLPGEPKRPPRSATSLFCKTQMELLKNKIQDRRERFAKSNKLWHNLSLQEKERYRKKALESKIKYAIELNKWFTTLPIAEQITYRNTKPSKQQYLFVTQMEINQLGREEACDAVYRPSDSEDEDIEDSSSSDEEEMDFNTSEVEEEDDDDVVMFEVY